MKGILRSIISFLWPIERHELKKFVPLLIMIFFVCFNYTVLRNLKDTLVITATASGAAVIPFIKVWATLPLALLSMMLFSYLTNRFTRNSVFYLIIGSFLAIYVSFSFFIYPMHEQLAAETLATHLQALLPEGLNGFIAMIRFWPLTLFYVMSELWSTMVLTVLFWGFVNEITRLSEAPRFYGILNVGSNAAMIIAGQVAVIISSQSFDPGLLFGSTAWEQTLDKLCLLVLFCGIGILACYHWMAKNVLPSCKPVSLKKEKKLSFFDSVSQITKSKYLLSIAIMVISYNLVIHMVEVIWKDQLRLIYPNPNDYNIYINNLTSLLGLISITSALSMVGIIRKFGWTKTALITPAVMLLTTSAFFVCILLDSYVAPAALLLLGTSPVALAVLFGSLQNCFTKAAKYSIFDTTKEMAFIPLPSDLKLKGKAAIDGVGSRMGKSGGSLMHQGLLIFFGTLTNSTPYVALILLIVIGGWIYATKYLGTLMQASPEADSTFDFGEGEEAYNHEQDGGKDKIGPTYSAPLECKDAVA